MQIVRGGNGDDHNAVARVAGFARKIPVAVKQHLRDDGFRAKAVGEITPGKQPNGIDDDRDSR